MTTHILHPINDACPLITKHGRLSLHQGSAITTGIAPTSPLSGAIVVPAHGECIIALRGDLIPIVLRNILNPGFGTDLTITGESPDGPFQLRCLSFHLAWSSPKSNEGWCIVSPVNEPTTITYRMTRPIVTVKAEINNFDFLAGNVPVAAPDGGEQVDESRLNVEAAGRMVQFVRRADYDQLKRFVAAGIFPTASFCSFSFEAREGESETELIQFVHNVSSLCALAARQHTGVSVMSFLDGEGHVIKRIIGNVVESCSRDAGLFERQVPNGITKLFQKCFQEHVRMQGSPVPWRQLYSRCAGIEDPPYLEQKFASLMMVLEFLMKNVLRESTNALASEEVERMELPKLLGCLRSKNGWDIPKHYMAK